MNAHFPTLHRIPRWLPYSFLYPIVTWGFYGLSSSLPSGGSFGAVGYVLAMLAFLLNLPGILVVQRFYHSATASKFVSNLVFPAASLITWALCIIPITWLGVSIIRGFQNRSKPPEPLQP